MQLPFADRESAGAELARRLRGHAGADALVLAVPRGGVTVAVPVVEALGAELDVTVARKLGAPGHEELAIGAITADGTAHLNDELIARLDVSPEYLEAVTARELREARRRERRFRGDRPPPRIDGRVVIIVDDGLATGATMFAAVAAVRRQHPARLIVAIPVAPRETCAALSRFADEVVCLATPEPFSAVGLHYQFFPQLQDDEVTAALDDARRA